MESTLERLTVLSVTCDLVETEELDGKGGLVMLRTNASHEICGSWRVLAQVIGNPSRVLMESF
jgi:hypothetical protein